MVHRKAFCGLAALAQSLIEGIDAMAAEPGAYIDPDDRLIGDLRATYEAIEAEIPKLLLKKAQIDRGARLQEHHCELLHAYAGAIDASAVLVEAMKDLRAAIIRRDLAAEPRDGDAACASIGELVAVLRTSPAP